MKLLLLAFLISVYIEASADFSQASIAYKAGDYKKSFIMFKELAQTNSDAAYILAHMYENGEGCEVNKEEALKWYKVSARDYYKQKRMFTPFEALQNSETENTIGQYFQSLYNFRTHNANYVLPASYLYEGDYVDTNGHQAIKLETEFQYSVRFDIGRIYTFAYTQKSFWQSYQESAFFRESNYNPEFFITIPVRESILKDVRVGVAHESNGRGGAEERSWNYASATLFFEYKMLFAELKLWSRLSDVHDYNPDLMDYMGHGHIKFMLPYKKHFADMKLKYNSKNRVTMEANYSYPIFGRDDLFLYTKIFDGYCESLIDYDNKVKKIGIGISISR